MKIDVKKWAIEGASRLLLSGHLWSAVKKLCLDAQNNTNLDNAAKQAVVKSDLKIIFKDTASIILNLAIELGALYVAVAYPEFAGVANGVKDKIEESTADTAK